VARKIPVLGRFLGAPALYAMAYGEIGSSLYYALGITAVYALSLTPAVFLAALWGSMYASHWLQLHDGGARTTLALRVIRALALGYIPVAVIFFATQSDRFLSVQNFSLILQQVMVVGTIAIGQTLIILTAGIDLSCGMVMALGGIVMTKLAVGAGMNAYLAIVCGLLACMAFVAVNHVLVALILKLARDHFP